MTDERLAAGAGENGLVLDHLALASRRAWDNVVRYCYHLGGRWLGGPTERGVDPFYFCQVGFSGGTKLEFIEPYDDPGSEFIERFLDRNGPGPHHLTYKVSDIEATMASAEAAGYRIVNQSLDDADWKEAFLHPKQSHGIVIQLAQQGQDAGWEDPPPLPPTDQDAGGGSAIDALTLLVADLDAAGELFCNVLAMDQRGDGVMDHALGRRLSLRSGPWTLHLVAPAPGPAAHWLGERNGRLLQVEMSVPEPATVPGLQPAGDHHLLAPEQNLGTRVLITRSDLDR